MTQFRVLFTLLVTRAGSLLVEGLRLNLARLKNLKVESPFRLQWGPGNSWGLGFRVYGQHPKVVSRGKRAPRRLRKHVPLFVNLP